MTNNKEPVQGEATQLDAPQSADASLSAQKGDLVGFANPPKHSQFKKGKSGNPKGRPKGSKSFNTVVQDAFDQQVSMTKNGKTMKVPLIHAMMTKVIAMALTGNPTFMKMVFELYAASHPAANDNGSAAVGSSFELSPEEWAAIEKANLLKKSK